METPATPHVMPSLPEKLSCCQPIDALLNGGFESGIVTTIYGPPSSGKTNLCIMASISCLISGKKAVYIDTEGNFSADRFIQLSGGDSTLLSQIIILRPSNFEELSSAISSLSSLAVKNIGLVIVDSIAMPYRLELADARSHDSGQDVFRTLGRMIYNLCRLAGKSGIPVIITSQVYSSFEDEKIIVIGGDAVKFGSKCMIELQSGHSGKRRAILRKHRSLPDTKTIDFIITNESIVAAETTAESKY